MKAGRIELAYEYYRHAGGTDLRSEWPSDDGGLHGAACAALPLALMVGFAGMRREGDTLRFDARLPEAWSHIEFPVCWRGKRHRVRLADGDTMTLP